MKRTFGKIIKMNSQNNDDDLTVEQNITQNQPIQTAIIDNFASFERFTANNRRLPLMSDLDQDINRFDNDSVFTADNRHRLHNLDQNINRFGNDLIYNNTDSRMKILGVTEMLFEDAITSFKHKLAILRNIKSEHFLFLQFFLSVFITLQILIRLKKYILQVFLSYFTETSINTSALFLTVVVMYYLNADYMKKYLKRKEPLNNDL